MVVGMVLYYCCAVVAVAWVEEWEEHPLYPHKLIQVVVAVEREDNRQGS
jgi:hypothetical protein